MSHERSSSLSTTFSSEPEQNRDFNFTLIPIITKLLNNIILSSSLNLFTNTNLFSLQSHRSPFVITSIELYHIQI